MSSTTDAALDPSCRILVVASTLSEALQLIEDIKQLSSPGSSPSSHTSPSDTSHTVPWTISNKYYTADVHFLAHTIHGLAPVMLKDVPAIVFTWSKGKAYQDNVVRLASDMSGAQPEVALAVQMKQATEAEEINDEPQSASDIDDLVASHGFEFIDHSGDSSVDADVEDDGIPTLPRVLDALGTIMWPSMQTAQSRLPTASRSLDWANNADETFDEDDLTVPVSQSSARAAMQARMRRDMEELKQWLEDEEGDRRAKDDPWKDAASTEFVSSPIDMRTGNTVTAKEGNAFEDDFTVFVSAPAENAPKDAVLEESFDSDRLQTGSSMMYHSLGSASDLGDLGDDAEDEEEDDIDLPTEEEILASSGRIFGSTEFPDSFSFDNTGGGEDEFASFDLSRVLGALQGMKEEIAGMENEEERRNAAAKVALGLVYGLEKSATPTAV